MPDAGYLRANATIKRQVPILLDQDAAQVIRALRDQGCLTARDFSLITGWSKAKTFQVLHHLIDDKLIIQTGEAMSIGGRKPRLICLNQNLGYLVGIDIGATSIDVVISDVRGRILQRINEAADVRLKPELFLNRCIELVHQVAATQGCQPDEILSIGIGVPGPVDFARGILVAPPLMPEWENFPIREYIRRAFPQALVVVDNDVNIMALGEKWAGDGKNIDHFLFVKIGTGIGAGIISNGRIHRGSTGCAGDIGHICVDKNGPVCKCGNVGCLEAMAAAPSIAEKGLQAAISGSSPFLKQIMENNHGVIRPEDVNAACREGDQAALEIIRESGQMIGDVLASLVNFFNPSHIFIGGGIANFGNHLLVAIRRVVLRRSLPLATTHLSINYSRIAADAGVFGAIALAMEHLFMVEDHPHHLLPI
ncbi:MAG: ROK family protein [Anaerolineales bacterium]